MGSLEGVRFIQMSLLSVAASSTLAMGYWFHGVQTDSRQPLPDTVTEQLLAADAVVTPPESLPPSEALPLPQDGAPTLPSRLAALQAKRDGLDRPLRIVQIGDSHTAGDFFTEQLRRRLQASYGDAGIGWIIPGPVAGQSAARYDIRSSGAWTFQTGRSGTVTDLPLGGFLNTGSAGSQLLIRPTPQASRGPWRFGALVRRATGSSAASLRLIGAGRSSQVFPLSAQWMPVELSLQNTPSAQYVLQVLSGRVDVAGLWIERESPGVVLDHIGRNGATLLAFQRWSDAAMASLFQARPVDAIVLAYGTNEAVDHLAASTYFASINTVVRRLQLAAPGTPVIILTAPSFSQGGGSQCEHYRPRSLRAVVTAQMAAGRLPGVQVWNWMQAMGGECSVAQWSRQGLMARDWIHMSPAGYRRSADLFFGWLLAQINPAP
jgi:lysophospholipase L1-like esterase